MQNVIAGLELRRKGLNRAAFGVARCSISDRRRKERGNGDGNKSGVLHRCCYFLIHYAASVPSPVYFILQEKQSERIGVDNRPGIVARRRG
jgi:hypothetical protein